MKQRTMKSGLSRAGITMGRIEAGAILEYLEDLEDIYLAEQGVRRIDSGEERTHPLKEVEARLDLED